MADRNKVRTNIRRNTVTNDVVLCSLHSCKLKNNLDILEDKITSLSPGYPMCMGAFARASGDLRLLTC